jgi:hypothetical protein
MIFFKKREKREDLILSKLNDLLKAPALNERYLQMLTTLESLYGVLLEPEGDDSLVIHKIRCMGLCGGWKAREQYLKGALHGKNSQVVAEAAEDMRLSYTSGKPTKG